VPDGRTLIWAKLPLKPQRIKVGDRTYTEFVLDRERAFSDPAAKWTDLNNYQLYSLYSIERSAEAAAATIIADQPEGWRLNIMRLFNFSDYFDRSIDCAVTQSREVA
jgi:hypothetical protein